MSGQSDKDLNAVLWLFILIAVIIAVAYAIGILLMSQADAAQWVNINQFKGLATHTNGIGNDPSVARYVDGWFVRSDGLEKPWFTKIRGNPVIQTPTYILGQNASSDRVLLFSNNFYSMTNGVIDPIGYLDTTTVQKDTALTTLTTDSIIYSWEDGHGSLVDTSWRGADSWWLQWALSTRASIVWNSINIPIAGFYSNRWILNNSSSQTIQTKPLGYPLSTPSVNEGSGTLDLPIDSTLIFDGTNIWVYSGATDSILNSPYTTVRVPHYVDTGRVINVWMNGSGTSDTILNFVIDPPDSVYTGTADSTDGATKFWILWDDSLITNNHAQPCSTLWAVEYSTDSMKLTVLADSSRFTNVLHFFGRSDTTTTVNGASGSRKMFYLLYRPGILTQRARIGSNVFGNGHDSLTYIGKYGNIYYARFRTHARDGNGIEDLDGFNTRTTDLNVWQLTTDAGVLNSDDDTAFCRITGYSSTSADYGSSFRWFEFLLWDTDTIKTSEWCNGSGGGNAINSLYYRPKIGLYNATTNPLGWVITTVNTTTSNDRFATIHRQRGWSSGNTHINSTTDKRDSSLWVRYTRTVGPTPGDTSNNTQAKNYLTFPVNNKFMLEGSDPVTGLSSLGQTLAIYRRRSISLLTGFAPGDFYVQPAPVGQGAANHWCIARSPLHNADVLTNENGIFMFGGGGLETLTPNILEVLKDSVNWYAENKLRASVYDNMYFVSTPFGSDTTNTRIIGIDLESREPWLMSRPRASGVWNFRDDDGSEQQFFGDADSTIMWELYGSSNNLYFTPEWKSEWTDLGDPQSTKRVTRYRIEFDAGIYSDSIFVDWYKDFLDTLNYNDTLQQIPLWTDTVPCNTSEAKFLGQYPSSSDYPTGIIGWTNTRNAARGMDGQRQTVYRPVSRVVTGKFLSFGIRARGQSTQPMTVMRFGFEYEPIQDRKQ